MSRKLTTEEFIERARKVHGDRYDYSQSVYVNSEMKVKIICATHGIFEQLPASHFKGFNCRLCGNIERSKTLTRTLAEFLRKAKEQHRDRYDYSGVKYSNGNEPVEIICEKHGPFKQRPNLHVKGYGCQKCGNEITTSHTRTSREGFIERAKAIHDDKFDYTLVDYKNKDTPVTIICPDHGEFSMRPSEHLVGQYGCRKCGGTAPLTTEEFVSKSREIHGDRYDYQDSVYRTTHENVTIICPDHGPYTQLPSNHLSGKGCASCAPFGFDPEKPGILYYLRIETRNQTLYKIGVTNNSVEKRFAGSDLKKITILQITKFDDGIDAWNAEREILRQFATDRYLGESVLTQVGTSEMFARDILGLDKSSPE